MLVVRGVSPLSETIRPFDVIANQRLGVQLVQIVGSQVHVLATFFLQAIPNHQYECPTAIRARRFPRLAMTPNYSLNNARSRSDTYTASISSIVHSTSPLRASAILTLCAFHEISRAAGPKSDIYEKQGGGVDGCLPGAL